MNFFQFFNKWIFPIVILFAIYAFTKEIWYVVLVVVCFLLYKLFRIRDFFYSIKAKRCIGNTDYLGAINNYNKAIAANSNNAKHYLEKGYILMLIGDFEQAKDVFSNITSSRFPHIDCINAMNYLSIAEWKLGNIDKATKLLEQTHTENYQSSTTYGNLTYFYILSNEYDKALTLANEAYSYNPNNPVIVENLARVYHLLGDLEQSEKFYLELEQLNPRYPEAWYNYALLLLDKNQPEMALEKIKNCLTQEFTYLTAITPEDAKQLNEQILSKLSTQ